MNDGDTMQLCLFHLSALDYSASTLVQDIEDKVRADYDMGLLGLDDYEADFADDVGY